jgi:carbonic anhydrase/acetyltransferase-like protein (isoleucine patch superfamily)
MGDEDKKSTSVQPRCHMDGSTVMSWKGLQPEIGKEVFIATGARVIGDVVLGAESNVWFNVVMRADVNSIRVGFRTNIQDNAVVHVTRQTGPTNIGSDVTIGHSAVIHACTIEDNCLIGMGAVILDGARIRKNSLVAAGSIVSPGKDFPPGSLIMGSPAKLARPLSEKEIAGLQDSADHYVELARTYFSRG